ncbi:MAG: copper-binding protein [Acidobacteriota bacterium]
MNASSESNFTMTFSLSRRFLAPVLVTVTVLVMLSLGGCAEPAPPEPDAVYTTRALVRQIPITGDPRSELQLTHEEVPEYENRKGEVVGMKSMTMPFPIDDALLTGIEAGDRVEFEFAVRWEGSPPLEVVRIDKLPADTLLSFEAAAEAEAGDEEAEGEEAEGETPMTDDHAGHGDHTGHEDHTGHGDHDS